MINSIIRAISISLNGEFGRGYTNYTEEVKQGLKEPCFFISHVSHTNRQLLRQRYSVGNLFCIQYFPADRQRKREECHEAAARLERCLEYLNVGGELIRGRNVQYEIADGILHFFVNYDVIVRRETSTLPAMDGMAEQISVKG